MCPCFSLTFWYIRGENPRNTTVYSVQGVTYARLRLKKNNTQTTPSKPEQIMFACFAFRKQEARGRGLASGLWDFTSCLLVVYSFLTSGLLMVYLVVYPVVYLAVYAGLRFGWVRFVFGKV